MPLYIQSTRGKCIYTLMYIFVVVILCMVGIHVCIFFIYGCMLKIARSWKYYVCECVPISISADMIAKRYTLTWVKNWNILYFGIWFISPNGIFVCRGTALVEKHLSNKIHQIIHFNYSLNRVSSVWLSGFLSPGKSVRCTVEVFSLCLITVIICLITVICICTFNFKLMIKVKAILLPDCSSRKWITELVLIVFPPSWVAHFFSAF